ncbi:MAG: peptidylprolyl isomerase [Candidatus Kapabacteria bacterium]|nr:peptidylprolyl isomerase [Candidatus Kapabacteria bacterium]
MDNHEYVIHVSQNGKLLGDIYLKLKPEVAPNHVKRFEELVEKKFYDGCAFHRVIPGFMIQGGDPNSKSGARNTWGMGDGAMPKVNSEFNKTPHKRGILSAARTNDPNSFTCQFFICVADAAFLDNQYTVFGEVTKGMDIADKVVSSKRDAQDNPFDKISMIVEKTK